MNFKLFLIGIIICSSVSPYSLLAGIRISEVMPINLETIDDENEFPESWIELYNDGEKDSMIYNYKIMVSTENEIYTIKKEINLKSNSYTLFYCDEKQYSPHIPFKLPYNKRFSVKLISPDNEVVDEIIIPEIPQAGISYGINPKNPSETGWLPIATPNKENKTPTSQLLAPPQIEFNSTIFKEKTTIKLSLPKNAPEGAVIRYTTDGSRPSDSSSIAPQELELRNTTVLKASTFAQEAIPSKTITQTFINLERDVTLPIISLSIEEKFLYDDTIGIYTEGNYNELQKNYQYDWHRPVTIEFFDTLGVRHINQMGEVRIAGATSRQHPQKSLILYAKKRLGGETFNYPFWNIKPNIKNSPSILLRNAGNDFLYAHLRDAACQTFFAQYVDNIDWQAYQPAILLLNGEYWGITNIRERSNIDYLQTNHKVYNADVIENWLKVNSGSIREYWKFVEEFSKEDITYGKIAEKIDVDEFINLLILEAYFGNIDFPDNNIVMWKEQKEGAKWRWIAKDLDMGWHYRFDRTPGAGFFHMNFFDIYLAIDSTSGNWEEMEFSTRLMRRLAKKEQFKEKLIDRFTIYMGDFLNQKYIVKTLDSLAKNIEYEFPYTYDKYADYRVNDYADWYEEIEIMRNFPLTRNIMNTHALKNFYQLGEIFELKIDKGIFQTRELYLNDIKLKTNQYNGHYYENRELRIELKKEVEDSLNLEGWEIVCKKGEETDTFYYSGNTLPLMIEEKNNYEQIYVTPTDTIPTQNFKRPAFYMTSEGIVLNELLIGNTAKIYDLQGRELVRHEISKTKKLIPFRQKGVYLLLIGDKCHKIVK